MPPTVQFVDKVDANPTVRLNINTGKWAVLDKDTDFSPPPLRRAIADPGVLRDGAEIPASAYDNRILQLHLLVNGTSQDDLATELQKLNRELNRARNFLKYQPEGATNPVFFRTFRSPDYDLNVSVEESGEHNARVRLRLIAEPFALGLAVTGTATLNFDPAAGTNPGLVDITGVTGDVETPLLLQVKTDPLSGISTSQELVIAAIRRHGTPSDGIWVSQFGTPAATGWTGGTDTGAEVTGDAAMSGGNYRRCSFATDTSMVMRLEHTTFPVLAATTRAARLATRGSYRLLIRLRHSVAGDTIKVRAGYGLVNFIYGDTITLDNTTAPRWYDLGLILPLPLGPGPSEAGYSGDPLAYEDGPYLKIEAQRSSGTGNLDFDALMLFPADEEMVIADLDTFSSWAHFDGPNDTVWIGISTSGETLLAVRDMTFTNFIAWAGKLPMVTPNQTNRLLLQLLRTSTTLTSSNSSVDLAWWYWPRWLYTRP